MFGTHSISGRIEDFRRAVYNRGAREPHNRPELSMSATNPAPYPGNPSLPREVREKILSTFRHTLNLFGQGKLDDCVIGCDFILKMDPRFAPARRLMEKARNPAAEVDVAQLESLVATTPTRQERVVAADPDRLLVRAVESFNARDFDAAIAAANQVLAVLPGNQDALEILDQAKAKKAAQPVFDASRQRALAALDAHRQDDAAVELDKMRQLDPDHPAVALLERRLSQMPPPAPPAAARPSTATPRDMAARGGDLDALSLDFPASAPASPASLPIEEPVPDPAATMALDLGSISSREPIPAAAGPSSGLEGLSLDSLSLDLPPASPQVVPPPPNLYGHGPLGEPAPAAVPGSPQDLWTEPPPEPVWSGMESGPQIDLPPPEPEPPQAPLPHIPEMAAPSVDRDAAAASDREIAGLLRQGDEAARKGDRQQAIEIWSRIFLIDINNSDAVSRIEKTRQEMAEGNRVVSEGLKSGRESFEAGDYAKAREAFLRVLAVDENEATARFYLDRIEAEIARGPAAAGEQAARPGASAASQPAPAAEPAPAPQPAAARSRRGIAINPRVLALVGALVVLAVAGVFLVRKFSPAGGAGRKGPGVAARPPAMAPASVDRARQLVGAGKVGEARAELRRIPPDSPDHAAAQALLGELAQSGRSTGPGSVAAAGPSAAQAPGVPGVAIVPAAPGAPAPASDAVQLRAAAEKALSEKRYIEALKNFHLAAPAYKNDPTFSQAMGIATDKVTTLTPAVKLYNEGEYETAIPVLWRITQDDRTNQDARSYLLRAYYNQGITQLQNGLYTKAAQSFTEALAIDPTDAEAIRHKKFAERYSKSDLDLMGRIYVRHVNRRP
jgi:tetratricopeptide (TPR) repeat protein